MYRPLFLLWFYGRVLYKVATSNVLLCYFIDEVFLNIQYLQFLRLIFHSRLVQISTCQAIYHQLRVVLTQYIYYTSNPYFAINSHPSLLQSSCNSHLGYNIHPRSTGTKRTNSFAFVTCHFRIVRYLEVKLLVLYLF